jgi:hypothetical protein
MKVYDRVHNLANNHRLLRRLPGLEDSFGEEAFTFEYQNIYDNLSKLSDSMPVEINEVIVGFGHREILAKLLF